MWVSGVDLVDGTPVFDIKPYVPYADAPAGATSRFSAQPPPKGPVRLAVAVDLTVADRAIIEQSIALQPQPAYQETAQRTYGADLAGWQVRWRNEAGVAVILECHRPG